MSKPIRYYSPRIYLDTNVLISAILESDKKWQRDHRREAYKKREEINTSERLYNEWEPKHLKTSLFAISEFISTGRTGRFSKTFKEMMEIVANKILPKCRILYAKFPVPKPFKLDKRWREYWILGKATCRGMAKNRKGNSLGMQEVGVILTTDMRLVRHFSGGIPRGEKIPAASDVVIEKIEQMSYGAPAFEILLFNKASELAIAYDLHLSDAIHLLHAKNRAEFIITNDKNFIKRWEKIDPDQKKKMHLKLVTSKEILEKWYR